MEKREGGKAYREESVYDIYGRPVAFFGFFFFFLIANKLAWRYLRVFRNGEPNDQIWGGGSTMNGNDTCSRVRGN